MINCFFNSLWHYNITQTIASSLSWIIAVLKLGKEPVERVVSYQAIALLSFCNKLIQYLSLGNCKTEYYQFSIHLCWKSWFSFSDNQNSMFVGLCPLISHAADAHNSKFILGLGVYSWHRINIATCFKLIPENGYI